MSNTTTNLTTDSLALFIAYAKDAGNWNGTPCVGGNVNQGPKENGHLTDLKKKELLTTFKSNGEEWIKFTDAGKALALEHGVAL